MTTTPAQQPEALRLADALEKMPGYDWNKTYCEAAFQLRHIQRQNECLTDAYCGAREDLAIWKRRAMEAEEKLRAESAATSRLVSELNAENGPTHMGEPAMENPELAGMNSAIGHLSALVDDQHRLLIEVVDVCGRDAYGAEFEDGESDLIDRVRSHLAMLAPLPIDSAQKSKPDEPIGVVETNAVGAGGFHVRKSAGGQHVPVGTQIYTRPQRRDPLTPLTPGQCVDIADAAAKLELSDNFLSDICKIVEMVEVDHGIVEKP